MDEPDMASYDVHNSKKFVQKSTPVASISKSKILTFSG
jgi:hypothetical protein